MKYVYYPGCSLEGTAREYDLSTRALLGFFGSELVEIEDWSCCGASAAESTSRLLSLALPARNLALAAKSKQALDVLVPCSACYLNLKKVEEKMRTDAQTASELNEILAAEGLALSAGRPRVRHLLDVLVNDIEASQIRARATRTLRGLRIAPYYGCQCLRPYSVFDDPEKPRSMEPLIAAAGAVPHRWDMGGRCCGASHMTTKMDVGFELVGAILKAGRGADAIVTVCPMCQMNLEAHQRRISRLQGEDLQITVLYLPQLLGLALGIPQEYLRMDLNLSVTSAFRQKLDAIPYESSRTKSDGIQHTYGSAQASGI
jgi:heterodisulfide reductase subunit B